MKTRNLLIMAACVALAGCEYTVPLVKTPELAIDKSLLGLWQRTKEDGQTEQLLVLPLGEREYLVSYPAGSKDGMFARVCLARVAGLTLAQLQWFGTAAGEPPEDNRVYQFAAYSVSGEKLTIRLLNSDVVKKDVASTQELVKAITDNKDNPDLFKQDLVFTKVKK
jgi:hypothetical protein